ncbi:unnamed protein product [Brassica napus]|uniref:(rape) hypothetical protein n=1 Tax=Brassica napus TaxID=3708 RepID=A0A816K8R6_BRANA|nr:unnamed protein product [Brassica napus]
MNFERQFYQRLDVESCDQRPSRTRPKPSHPFLSEEAKKPYIEKCLEVVATLEARTVLVRRLNLTYVMFSLCEYVKLSK